MTLNIVQVILVIIVAFLAGMEGVLDEFHFHQPIIACTLIGLATGNLLPCLILGGSLQMMALGWANIGAAVAPDAALASVASAIILVLGGQGKDGVPSAIAIAVPLAVAGLLLTIICRTIATAFVHFMDSAAKEGNMRKIEMWQIIAICMQGVRIAIPAALILAIGAGPIRTLLQSMPIWLTDGLANWWWNGCSRRLCNGNQHDGYKRSMAILCNWFCISNCFTNYTYRTWCDWCSFSSCLLGTWKTRRFR